MLFGCELLARESVMKSALDSVAFGEGEKSRTTEMITDSIYVTEAIGLGLGTFVSIKANGGVRLTAIKPLKPPAICAGRSQKSHER